MNEIDIFLLNKYIKGVINIVGIINIIPPIVGVPALLLCASTYTFILCPAFIFFNNGIKNAPNTVDIIKPIINANKDLVSVSIITHIRS